MLKYVNTRYKYLNENNIHTNEIKKNIKFIWDELQFIKPKAKKFKKFTNYTILQIFLSNPDDKEIYNTLKKKLNDLKEYLIKNGVMLSFFINYSVCDIYLKTINNKSKPTKYVYHSSPIENRESILKNGLIPKSSDESKEWAFSLIYSYPKAIFATKINNIGIINPWKKDDKHDIWRINTKGLKNEWFTDLNFIGEKDNNHIMTFEPIPSKNLELVISYQ